MQWARDKGAAGWEGGEQDENIPVFKLLLAWETIEHEGAERRGAFLSFFFFWPRVSLCGSGKPWTRDPLPFLSLKSWGSKYIQPYQATNIFKDILIAAATKSYANKFKI